MQKIRLWWRGSQRRRDEQRREFLEQNTAWSAPPPAAAAAPAPSAPVVRSRSVDREGLQAAYLDQSGVFRHYLDLETGEVVESRTDIEDPRFARVPTQSDEDDQRAFLRTLSLAQRARFQRAASFRAALAEDRTLERGWYNFKNERATAAIEEWLRRVG